MGVASASSGRYTARGWVLALWVLAGLFLARVLGQVLVAFFHVSWLPPMSEWYSGLMPYPWLLPSQVAILAMMGWINVGAMRQSGFFATARPRLGRFLVAFAALYAVGMAVRYVVSGSLHPERRFWPPGSIPIVFHWVLALYLYATARVCRR